MEASFPARKSTVSRFRVYMDSGETRPAGILADRGGISPSRVSRPAR